MKKLKKKKLLFFIVLFAIGLICLSFEVWYSKDSTFFGADVKNSDFGTYSSSLTGNIEIKVEDNLGNPIKGAGFYVRTAGTGIYDSLYDYIFTSDANGIINLSEYNDSYYSFGLDTYTITQCVVPEGYKMTEKTKTVTMAPYRTGKLSLDEALEKTEWQYDWIGYHWSDSDVYDYDNGSGGNYLDGCLSSDEKYMISVGYNGYSGIICRYECDTGKTETGWTKTLGGSNCLNSIALTSDGGYIVAGYTKGTKFTYNEIEYELADCSSETGSDAFIMKIDKDGNYLWHKSIASAKSDEIVDVCVDVNGNIIAVVEYNGKSSYISVYSGDGTSNYMKELENASISAVCTTQDGFAVSVSYDAKLKIDDRNSLEYTNDSNKAIIFYEIDRIDNNIDIKYKDSIKTGYKRINDILVDGDYILAVTKTTYHNKEYDYSSIDKYNISTKEIESTGTFCYFNNSNGNGSLFKCGDSYIVSGTGGWAFCYKSGNNEYRIESDGGIGDYQSYVFKLSSSLDKLEWYDIVEGATLNNAVARKIVVESTDGELTDSYQILTVGEANASSVYSSTKNLVDYIQYCLTQDFYLSQTDYYDSSKREDVEADDPIETNAYDHALIVSYKPLGEDKTFYSEASAYGSVTFVNNILYKIKATVGENSFGKSVGGFIQCPGMIGVGGSYNYQYADVESGKSWTNSIIAVPNKNYEVSKIIINGTEIDFSLENDGKVTIPYKYTSNVTNDVNIEVIFEPTGKVITHHYYEGTDKSVSEDVITKNEVDAEYTTSEVTIDGLELASSKGNLTGNYEEKPVEVIYYYKSPIELTIHHYLDGTTEKLKEDTTISGEPVLETQDGKIYTFTGFTYDVSENNEYKTLNQVNSLTSVLKDEDEIEISDKITYTSNTSLTYYYTKGCGISGETITHTETSKDGTAKKVKGGKIYNGNMEEYTGEVVKKGNDSTIAIVIKADDEYAIKKVEIVDDGEKTELDLTQYDSDEDGIVEEITLPAGYFENIDTSIDVKVEFAKKTSVTLKYLEVDTKNPLSDSVIIKGVESDKYDPVCANVSGYRLAKVDTNDSKSSSVTFEETENDTVVYNSYDVSKDNVFYADTVTVVYWYEKIPEGTILEKHIEITQKDIDNGLNLNSGNILDEESHEDFSVGTETLNRKTNYDKYIPISGPESSNDNIISVESSENSIDVNYVADKPVEASFYYIKQFDIKTEVDGTGGTISGSEENVYEKVNKYGKNASSIEIVPEAGYKIASVKINDRNVNFSSMTDSDGKIVIANGYFSNVNEDILVSASFEKVPAKVIVKYIDVDTNKEIATSTTKSGYVGDWYTTEAKAIDGYELTGKSPSDGSGRMSEDDITVIYYYKVVSKSSEDDKENEKNTQEDDEKTPSNSEDTSSNQDDLASSTEEQETIYESGASTADENSSESDSQKGFLKTNKEQKTSNVNVSNNNKNNPKTGDKVVSFVKIFVVATIMLAIVVRKKKIHKKRK